MGKFAAFLSLFDQPLARKGDAVDIELLGNEIIIAKLCLSALSGPLRF